MTDAVRSPATEHPSAACATCDALSGSEPVADVLRRRYVVRPTECNASDRLAPTALLDLFQDAAGADADRLGFGLADMMPHNRAWVLHRIAVRVTGVKPRIGEGVTVETWPAPGEGALSARHARVFDDDGAAIAAITSRWLYIDVAQRRPLRPPPELLARARADLPPTLALDAPPTAPAAPTSRVPMTVLRRDLDVMDHANNVHFAEWMMEAIPADIARRPLVSLDLLIRAEALYGDALLAEAGPAMEPVPSESDAAPVTHAWDHVLHRDGDARPIAMMRTVWR